MSRRLELNHWFINGNTLDISLSRFCIRINKKNCNYNLDVYQDSNVVLSLSFDTLEEAISFTEEVIAKCHDNDEINRAHQDIKSRKRIKNKKPIYNRQYGKRF